MIGLGSQLYRLNQRDEDALLMLPFFGNRTITHGVGSTFADVAQDIPQDRCLVLSAVSLSLGQEAATRWTFADILWRSNPGAGLTPQFVVLYQWRAPDAVGLTGDGQVAAAGTGQRVVYAATFAPVLLPPGGSLVWRAERVGTTAAVDSTARAFGWQIPAANVGRLS